MPQGHPWAGGDCREPRAGGNRREPDGLEGADTGGPGAQESRHGRGGPCRPGQEQDPLIQSKIWGRGQAVRELLPGDEGDVGGCEPMSQARIERSGRKYRNDRSPPAGLRLGDRCEHMCLSRERSPPQFRDLIARDLRQVPRLWGVEDRPVIGCGERGHGQSVGKTVAGGYHHLGRGPGFEPELIGHQSGCLIAVSAHQRGDASGPTMLCHLSQTPVTTRLPSR